MRSLFLGVAALCCCHATAVGQVRVATYNVAQLRGELTDVMAVLDTMSTDDARGPAADLSVIVMQEVQSEDHAAILAGLGGDWSGATYTNDNEDGYGGAQACFYRADQLIELTAGHDDLYTGAGRRCDRWQFQLLGHDAPPVRFYLYSAHLKAGTGSTNEAERLTGADRILDDLATLPAGTPAIVCGDMNFYSNNEDGYQAFTNILVDPLGTGSWGGESQAIKHTQSPRSVNSGGLASGGLDDRFDFMLVTPTMHEADGLSIITNSQRAVGNDGQHYNAAINDGNNTYFPGDMPRSNTLADHLHDASDHIPVMADFFLPAVLQVDGGGDVGALIEGAAIETALDVTNAAGTGAADLHWSVAATGDAGALGPGEGQSVSLPVEPGVLGPFDESLLFEATGDFVQHAPMQISVTGTVLSHAVPSLAPDTQVTSLLIPLTLTAGTGVHTESVPLWNLGWTTTQSKLDVDAVTGGLDGLIVPPTDLPSSLSAFPAVLNYQFDTDLFAPGNLFASFQIATSDQDIPGEGTHGLSVTFTITVEADTPDCPGDVDGDGVVNVADLLVLLDVWGTNDADADVTQDGIVNVDDLLVVLGDWGC